MIKPSVALALLSALSSQVDAQRPADDTRIGGFVGIGADPFTAALGLEARYRIGSLIALTATAGHWFLEESCDNALVGPCTPSDAWTIDAGATLALRDPVRGWQPYAAARVGPARFNYKPSTVWTASTGVGLTQTGRSLGVQLELRYHILFGGDSPPPAAVTDRLVFYAGIMVRP